MVEEQVDVEGLIPDLKWDLAADESETAAQFEEQIPEMDQKTTLDLALMRFAGDRQKIEVVGVFQDLFGQV